MENKIEQDEYEIWKKLNNKCECGSSYTNRRRYQHFRTSKHKNFICLEVKNINCDCGGKYLDYTSSEYTHKQTIRHKKYITERSKAT